MIWLDLDLKNAQAALLELYWVYDILDLDLKNTWTTITRLGLIFFCEYIVPIIGLILLYFGLELIKWINQAEIPW